MAKDDEPDALREIAGAPSPTNIDGTSRDFEDTFTKLFFWPLRDDAFCYPILHPVNWPPRHRSENFLLE